MKLTYEKIDKYISDYLRDPTKEKYTDEERLRDINSAYFSVLNEIDRLKGVSITKDNTDIKKVEISFAEGETLKPLTEDTNIVYVDIDYDNNKTRLRQIFEKDYDDVETLRDAEPQRPTSFFIREGTIEILPKSDKPFTAIIHQSQLPPELTGITSPDETPRLHRDLHSLLWVIPVIEFMTKRDMRIPNRLQTKEIELYQKMKMIYSPQRTFKITYKKNLIR